MHGDGDRGADAERRLHGERDADAERRLDAAVAELRSRLPAMAGRTDFPPELAEVLSAHRLTALCLPAGRGGCGRPLSALVHAVNRVSTVDAGVGWCLFILGSAPWLLCHADERLAAEVFTDPTARVAGSLAPAGAARRTATGFVLDGRWPFGSGATASHWVVVRAVVQPDGEAAHFVVPRDRIDPEPWDGIGLPLSGSGAFRLTSVPVPAYRMFGDVDGASRWPEPELVIPFRATFAAGAAVLVGIAERMLTEFVDLAGAKRSSAGLGPLADQARIQALVGRARGTVDAARAVLDDAVRRIEADACSRGGRGGGSPAAHGASPAAHGPWPAAHGPWPAAHGPWPAAQVALRLAVVRVREYCLGVVDDIHLAAGSGGVPRASTFAQLFVDAHTVGQHKMFSADVDQQAGATLLGRNPGPSPL